MHVIRLHYVIEQDASVGYLAWTLEFAISNIPRSLTYGVPRYLQTAVQGPFHCIPMRASSDSHTCLGGLLQVLSTSKAVVNPEGVY